MKYLILLCLFPLSAQALAPFAYQVFCAKNPDPTDCQIRSGVTGSATDLRSVKSSVDFRFRKVNDRKLADQWKLLTAAQPKGDCEDFAMTYRHYLIKRGWPSHALRLAIGMRGKESHAVLVAKSRQGYYVLDILEKSPVPLAKYKFDWGMIQTDRDPADWQQIRD